VSRDIGRGKVSGKATPMDQFLKILKVRSIGFL
jgi:hypothetical protein